MLNHNAAATTEENLGDQTSSDVVKFKGVRKRKWGKWVSEIRLPNSRERIWLGSYDSAEKAARAFDAALYCLRGRSAKFNFPDNPPDIPGGRSMTPPEIQLAAARFANEAPETSHTTRSMHRSVSESQMEYSPSPSVSDRTGQLDNEMNLDGSLPDMFTNWASSSSNYPNDYGMFAGLDYFSDSFLSPPTMPSPDYEDDNQDQYSGHDSFLWNFQS